MLDNDEIARRVRFAFGQAPRGVQAKIAKEADISAQAVNGWARTGKVDKAYLPTLARATKRKLSYFLDARVADGDSAEIENAEPDDHVPIVAYAQAAGLGEGIEAQEYAETHRLKFRADSLARKRLKAGNLAVFYGKGDSMEPRVHTGDAVLFDLSDTRPRDGALFVITVPGAGADSYSIKRCEMLDDLVLFKADNPLGDHQWRKPRRMDDPKKPIKIVGRVRWIGSWEG